ncbi:NACHT domain-containing protein [Burkholderia cepacia]|uniref:NACHT domain-containing protein n=1 Tax=Burkholderia cepacia TaxID=292 RepID=A0ABN5CV89_BURCE|nr:NACHT domain-containing protein [Burkholderia cepacia]ASE95880.1 NACHT domain-containing protein [Burkholderia cepacia]ATF79119.1 NACHT domain-containing protein [Burkholderia cepacia]MCA8468895.1 NACHT domain-containing protein [Burkholderia cepacia]MDN7766086.1 NACHT domain-containing protein [Burkholderia cepacia]QCY03368.1 NACHT domain-containing protein [Burkholderia cepacia ATCC 25416]
MSTTQSDRDFEDEVRRIARAKWSAAQYSGAQMLEGRERDGVFETEESINFIEATVSAGTGKAKEDTRKLFKAISEHNRTGALKIAIGWFVTKSEPTAEQRKEVQELGKGQVRAVSFTQFQQSLIDVRAYLSARGNHSFGSVQDFATKSKIPAAPFVEIGLSHAATDSYCMVDNIVTRVLVGEHFAIVGQYGAGKSMTLREIYMRLQDMYIKGRTAKFPVYINLREHSGQSDPIELLERHARSIGFDSPSSLIRAWRAGFVILLADGFDEVTSLGVQGSWKKLKDLRTRSLEGIRKLVRDSNGSGVVVSGRSHYFENESELCRALGLGNAQVLSVDEFNDDQVKKFLSSFPNLSSDHAFPAWLPTRPLLLGYLASRGLLTDFSNPASVPDAVDGWDYLLDRIYVREEAIETNLDGPTLRRILQRAATSARTSEDGLGPIARSDLFSAFSEVCGYEPDEQGVLAIQRLPGLGIYRAEDESRCFVDKELASVCNGRELLMFLESPYEVAKDRSWVDVMNTCDRAISHVGAELAVRRLKAKGNLRSNIQQATAFLNSRTDLACARGDVAMVLLKGSIEMDISLNASEISFAGDVIEFHQAQSDLSKLSFSHCIFDHVLLEPETPSNKLPYFDNCLFEQMSGRISSKDLPSDRFSATCEFVAFDSSGTNGAIRSAQMSIGEKVLLITLRKLFIQSLSGRAEGALFRGLDVDERRCVSDVLELLKRHQLATEYSRGDGVIWLPSRKALNRVKRMLAAPTECGEEIIRDARLLA